MRAVVSYTDDQGTTETVVSAPTAAVENTNDAPGGTLAIGGEAKQGATLTLADAITDADGIPAEGRSYRWQVEGEAGVWTDIADATGTAFTLTQAEVGHAVRAVLSYTDNQGTTETVESAATLAVENVNDEPGGALEIAGTAKQGEVLTLTNGVTDADGMQGASTYRWQVENEVGVWTDIAGAIGEAFTLTQAEVDRAVRAVLSYTDGHGATETVFGAATLAVENVNDEPGGALTVVGTAKQGEVLSLADAVVDADGMQNASRGYQ